MYEITNFTLQYIISLLLALIVAYALSKKTTLNPIITFGVVPLLISFLVIQILNAILPKMNSYGEKVSAYVENKTLGEINKMGYIQVFPPLFAVTILIFVLLFTNNLL